MAQYCLPHRLPVRLDVNARRDGPFRPCHSPALHAINMHDDIAENGLVGKKKFFGCLHIVQFRNTMRRQVLVAWSVLAGRLDNGSRGELANGDMIGMPVAALWPEGDHYIGLHAAY